MARPKKAQLTPMQKLAKAIGSDGDSIIQDLESMDGAGLNKRIAQAHEAIDSAKEELNQNPDYIRHKEMLKDVSSSFRDAKKRQNAIIKVCLELRRARGEA
jgi:hypothetical protein